MKHLPTKSHKLLAGILALLLCVTAVFPLSAAALDTDVPAAQVLLSEEDGVLKAPHSDISSTVATAVSSLNNTYAVNKAASKTAHSAVDAIVTGLLSLSEEIDISSYHLQFESFFAVYQEAVLRPEFFYVDNRFSYSYNATTKEIISVTPVYTMRGTELLEAQKQYNAGLNELLSGVDATWSDFEKILYLHDQLAIHYLYDTTLSTFDVYHMLTEGRAVCQGYTLLLQALLNTLGIENDTVTSEPMMHTWNLVRLNGNWYHIDVTWNDPVPDQYGQAFHLFLLKSDAYMQEKGYYGWECFEDISCTDTTYDNAFFNDVRTPFVNASDGNWYYINDNTGFICRWNPQTDTLSQVYSTEIRWSTSQGYYLSKFTGFAGLGNILLYNSATGIYAYHLDTQTVETVHLLSGSGYICGMTLQWSYDTSGNKLPYIYYQVKPDPSNGTGDIYSISAENLMLHTVSGTVTSSDSDTTSTADDMITISLISENNVYSTTVVSTGVNKTVTYRIDDVAPGSYTMMITKENHITGQYTVIVSSHDVTQNAAIYLLGDANHDGKADSSDAVAILRKLAGYDVQDFYMETADFNRDNKADSSDAVAILRKLAGY